MTKALFKKQMMEIFAWIYKDRKSGKIRSAQGIVLYAVLYLVLFGFLGSVFFTFAKMMCVPLAEVGMGWLYWCLIGLVSVFLGVFGSVFSTYSSLYQAKDNDLLLSMPIPPSRILAVRLFGVYLMGLIYELIVMVPAVIVWFIDTQFSAVGSVCVVLIPFLLSVVVLVLSALLGWVVALISGRIKHKNIVTVFISLAFIVGYYYIYFKAYSMIQTLLQNIEEIGGKIKSILYPLYQMGMAAEGNILSMLIFTAIVGALFLIVYAVLSHSFLKLATSNRGGINIEYKEKKSKSRSAGSALLIKEFLRFLGSSNYMLNCGIGILFMPISAVLLIWKAGDIRQFLLADGIRQYAPLLAVAAVCLVANINDMTAPSVSLEGKNLWIVQSLPVSCKQVLTAKLMLHLLLTIIPSVPLIFAVEWVIRPNPIFSVLIPIAIVLFVLLMAILGLLLNLKMPNLNWTSEIVPIKQSMSVMIALFGGWVVILALAGLYFILDSILSPLAYLSLVCVLLLAASILLLRWLFTKGAKIFSTL